MRRRLAVVMAVVVGLTSASCGSLSTPAEPPAPRSVAGPNNTLPAGWSSTLPWAQVVNTTGPARSAAVIDGFRVHPDPGDDGVIRVTEGDAVVVNAADVASKPPAPQSFLIVNWGDDSGNDRVSCGPCRLAHAYKAGRYSVTASADDLQPGTVKPSITFTVDVAPAVAPKKKVSNYAALSFQPTTLHVGNLGSLFVPVPFPPAPLPPDLDGPPLLICNPPFPALPPIFTLPTTLTPVSTTFLVFAFSPGTCSVVIHSHDTDGNTFTDTTTVTVIP